MIMHLRTFHSIRITIPLLLAIVLLTAARGVQAVNIKGEVMAKPAAVAHFNLTDQDGKPFTQQKLKGKWSLLYFGFTSCTTMCPVNLLQLSKFYLQLKSNGVTAGEMPQVLFISVDPARDTPAKMKTYVHHYNPDFIGLTGAEKQIKTLESFCSTQHQANTALNGQYQVKHSALVYLVNPKQQLVASFYPPFYIDGLVKDYLAVIDSETPTVSLNQHSASTPQLPSI